MTTRVTIPEYYLGEDSHSVDVKLVPVPAIEGIETWEVFVGDQKLGVLQRRAHARMVSKAQYTQAGRLLSASLRRVAETKWRAYGTPPSAWATKRVEVLAKMLRAARPAGV